MGRWMVLVGMTNNATWKSPVKTEGVFKSESLCSTDNHVSQSCEIPRQENEQNRTRLRRGRYLLSRHTKHFHATLDVN